MATRASVGRVDVEFGTRGVREATREVDAFGNRARGAGKRVGTAFEKINSKVVAVRTSLLKLRFIAVAVFGAMVFTLSRVIERMERATQVSRGFESLGARMGTTARILDDLRIATRGMLDDFELMRSANQALALQLPLTGAQMTKLFEGAVRLGRALGLDARQAIDSIVTGLGRQSRLMLDNLGIIVNADAAYRRYADAIGKTVKQLTEQEKKTAFVIEGVRQLTTNVNDLGQETVTFSDLWNRSMTQSRSALDKFLVAVNQAPERLAGPLQIIGTALNPGAALPGLVTGGALGRREAEQRAQLAQILAIGDLFEQNEAAAERAVQRLFDAGEIQQGNAAIDEILARIDIRIKTANQSLEEMAKQTSEARKEMVDFQTVLDEFQFTGGMEPGGVFSDPRDFGAMLSSAGLPGVSMQDPGVSAQGDLTRRLRESTEALSIMRDAQLEVNDIFAGAAMGTLDYGSALERVIELQNELARINYEDLTPSYAAQKEAIIEQSLAALDAAAAAEAFQNKQELLSGALNAGAGALLQMAAAGKFSARALVNAIAMQVAGTLSALAIEYVVRGMGEKAKAAADFADGNWVGAAMHGIAAKEFFSTAAKAGLGAVAAGAIGAATAQRTPGASAGGALEDSGPADLGGTGRRPAEIHIFIEGQGFIQDPTELGRELAEIIEREMNKGGVRG